jgi:hypothetical protein
MRSVTVYLVVSHDDGDVVELASGDNGVKWEFVECDIEVGCVAEVVYVLESVYGGCVTAPCSLAGPGSAGTEPGDTKHLVQMRLG